ncbi:MAG: hypothetical protein AAF360_06770 [Pseudomonadota bacterium]
MTSPRTLTILACLSAFTLLAACEGTGRANQKPVYSTWGLEKGRGSD